MKNVIKQVAVLLLGLMVCIMTAGCSKNTGNLNNEKEVSSMSSSEEDNSIKAMGRYVETSQQMTQEWSPVTSIFKYVDDSLLFLSQHAMLTSTDGAKTWSKAQINDETAKLIVDNYVFAMDVSENGAMAITYNMESEGFKPVSVIIHPDGEKVEVEKIQDESEDDLYFRWFCFGDDGRLFATSYTDIIYEVDIHTGAISEFLELENVVASLDMKDNVLLCPTYYGIELYDIEKEAFIEDDVLSKFIEENYGGFTSNDSQAITPFPFFGKSYGDEKIIYIAGEKGLYRHIIGGNMMEKIIEGSLSCLGDITKSITSMYEIGDEFVACFSDSTVVRFTYDESIPTMPDKTLVIYSLEENPSIKQAITNFRSKEQNVYIDYEIGMKSDAVTREDALKNLSTKLIDGSGPDIIVLDDMPINSYIEKGILLDIKETVEELNSKEQLLFNMIEPFYTDNSLYAVPTEFQVPYFYCVDGDMLSQIDSLKSLTAFFEKLRSTYPDKDLWGISTEYGTLKALAPVCAPCWLDDNNNINESALAEFLEEAGKIYEKQMNGLSQKRLEYYQKFNMYFEEEYGMPREKLLDIIETNEMDYIAGNLKAGNSIMNSFWGFASVYSQRFVEGCENAAYQPMVGQCKNVYMPSTLVGVNSETKDKELALDFVANMLGKDNQSSLGFPYAINKEGLMAGFDENQVFEENGEELLGYTGSSNDEGEEVTLKVYYPEQGAVDKFINELESVTTPYIRDKYFEDIVFTEGASYIKGEITLEKAMENIKADTKLYLSE